MLEVSEKNIANRNRKTQAAFRKKQLILATIDCIDSLGLSQTTLAKIAERVGTSQGNVVFHFRTKDILLEQALIYLDTQYRDCWQNAIQRCDGSASAQLQALVDASFDAQICTRKNISVWYAFWGEVRSRPKYFEVCGENDALFSETLLEVCQSLSSQIPSNLSAETAALSIEGMINGLWQNFLFNTSGFNRKLARHSVFELISVIYPEFKPRSA